MRIGRFAFTFAVAALLAGILTRIAHADLTRTENRDVGAAPETRDARAFQPPAGRNVLTLVWCDVEGVLPQGHEALARETTSILRTIDVAVAWRFSSPTAGGCATDPSRLEVAVVALALSSEATANGHRPLGSTASGGGLQALWVYVGEIRGVLGWGVSEPLDASRWRTLARAAGRVVAHEVTHRLVPGRGHDKHGLMRASFRRAELLAPELRIEPDWIDSAGAGWGKIVNAASQNPAEVMAN